jgi:hypothetical protein
MNDFYLTLPSNSSMEIFPNNKTTCYTTQLHKRLELDGVWEVGLVEFVMTNTVFNLSEGQNYLKYREKKRGKGYLLFTFSRALR